MIDPSTAAIFDANATSQNQCNLPPGVSGTDESNTITITRNVGDDPFTPGQQKVTSITFTDTNPITIGDDNTQPPVCTLDNANQATCPASDFTFDTGGAADSVTVNGNPTTLPNPFGNPGGCGGVPSTGFDPTLGAGDDTFNGSVGDDAVVGGAGVDTINGNGGNDTLEGGDGNDVIHGGDGNDCTDGGAGDDQEFGDAGNDFVGNSTGFFVFAGDSGNDTLDGGDGNDTLDPGAGPVNSSTNNTDITTTTDNDTMTGGNGLDRVDYSGRGSNRTVACTLTEDGQANDGEAAHKQNGPLFNTTTFQPQPSDVPAEADNIASDIETLVGCDGPNTIVGNNDDNTLIGGLSNDNIQGLGGADNIIGDAGDDTLDGGDGNDGVSGDFGNDTVNGGAGDDNLSGDQGNDTLNGGDGNDSLDGGFGPSRPDATPADSDSDVLNGGNGTDTVGYSRESFLTVTVSLDGQANDGEINQPNRLTENDNVGTDVEEVFGGNETDVFTGSPGDNILSGGDNNDTLTGNGGNDGLYGDEGDDSINAAGAGSTHLDGGNGNDTLVSADQSRDENECGGGTDSVSADGQDEVHGDCENVKVTPPAAVTIGSVSFTKTGYVLVRVGCPATEPRCTGVVTIKTAKRIGKIILKLGNPSYSAGGGKTAVVKALIPPKFRAALRKAKRVKLNIAVTNVNATTGLSSTKKVSKTVSTSALPKK